MATGMRHDLNWSCRFLAHRETGGMEHENVLQTALVQLV